MKETKGVRTKKHLYECAMELFRSRGYDQVTVDEIVKKAGMAKGTFYIYFHSKSDIIMEMLRRYDDYYDGIAASLPPELSLEERLDAIVAGACRFTQDVAGLDLIRVLYTKHLGETGKGRELLNEDRALFRIVLSIIEEGQKTGVYVDTMGAEMITGLILRVIRSVFFEWCTCGGNLDLAEECMRFLGALRQGICVK